MAEAAPKAKKEADKSANDGGDKSRDKALKKAEELAPELQAAIAAADEAQRAGNLEGALKALQPIEKKARLAQDATTCSKAVLHMLNLCLAAGDWEAMDATVQMIAKRRSQMQRVVTNLVTEAHVIP